MRAAVLTKQHGPAAQVRRVGRHRAGERVTVQVLGPPRQLILPVRPRRRVPPEHADRCRLVGRDWQRERFPSGLAVPRARRARVGDSTREPSEVTVDQLPLADPDRALARHETGSRLPDASRRGQTQQHLGPCARRAERQHRPLIDAVQRSNRAVARGARPAHRSERQPSHALHQRREPTEMAIFWVSETDSTEIEKVSLFYSTTCISPRCTVPVTVLPSPAPQTKARPRTPPSYSVAFWPRSG